MPKIKKEIIDIPSIDVSKASALEAEAKELNIKATALVITTQVEYEGVSEFLKKIKTRYSEIDTERKSITKPLDFVKKQIMDKYRPALEFLEQAEKAIKNSVLVYLDNQEKIRQEQEEKLRRQAEKERQEAEAKAAALRKQAEEEAAKGNAAKAAQLETKAELKEQKAATIVAPTIAPIQLVKGTSIVVTWYAEITDLALVPREYMIPNMKLLDGLATKMKDQVKIPGVAFLSERGISSRKNAVDVGF